MGKMDSFSKKAISLGRLKCTLKFFGSTVYDHVTEKIDHRVDEAPLCDALDIHF